MSLFGQTGLIQMRSLITVGATIGSTEASHATLIRAAFQSLGVDIKPVPASFVSAETRSSWILAV